jgi:hypothetical protein
MQLCFYAAGRMGVPPGPLQRGMLVLLQTLGPYLAERVAAPQDEGFAAWQASRWQREQQPALLSLDVGQGARSWQRLTRRLGEWCNVPLTAMILRLPEYGGFAALQLAFCRQLPTDSWAEISISYAAHLVLSAPCAAANPGSWGQQAWEHLHRALQPGMPGWPAACARFLHDHGGTLLRLHLVLFYLYGTYFQPAKRVTGGWGVGGCLGGC